MFGLSTITMAWIAGVCIAVYLGCIVYAITAPRKQPDPQRGMAVGCLMIAAIPGVVAALLLAAGVVGGYDTLVRILFFLTAVPAPYVAVLLIAQPIIMRRRGRITWEPPAADEPGLVDDPPRGGSD